MTAGVSTKSCRYVVDTITKSGVRPLLMTTSERVPDGEIDVQLAMASPFCMSSVYLL
jgi:hypothetical protein